MEIWASNVSYFLFVQFWTSKFRRDRGGVAQTIVEDEEARGVRDRLARLEVQPTLSGAICFVLLHVG
jgi:hypothetical protein